jgi:hypothetical protein
LLIRHLHDIDDHHYFRTGYYLYYYHYTYGAGYHYYHHYFGAGDYHNDHSGRLNNSGNHDNYKAANLL